MKETMTNDPFGLLYPEYKMREFYIKDEKQIVFNVSIVRYMNGARRCLITGKTKEGKYVLDDTSGTALALRVLDFEELKDEWVLVKFLDKVATSKQPGKPCTIAELEEANSPQFCPENQYTYDGQMYIRNKKDKMDILRFECRHLSKTEWMGPGKVNEKYHNDSFVSGEKGEDKLMLNSIIENEYEMVEPVFDDYKGE